MASFRGVLEHHENQQCSVDLEEPRLSNDGKVGDRDVCLPVSASEARSLTSHAGRPVGYETYRTGLTTVFTAEEV